MRSPGVRPDRSSRPTASARARVRPVPCDHRLGLFDEQGDQVVAPGSTGRRLLVEDDHGASRDADIEQPDGVAAGVGGPSSSHRARVHGWASRWGRGPLGHAQDDPETVDPGPGLRSLSHAVAVRRRPDGALACRPKRASAKARWDARSSRRNTSGRAVASTATRSAMRGVLLLAGGELGDVERAVGPMLGTTQLFGRWGGRRATGRRWRRCFGPGRPVTGRGR